MAEPTFTPLAIDTKCAEYLALRYGGALGTTHQVVFACDLPTDHDGPHDCGFDHPDDWRPTKDFPPGVGARAQVHVQWESPPPKPEPSTGGAP